MVKVGSLFVFKEMYHYSALYYVAIIHIYSFAPGVEIESTYIRYVCFSELCVVLLASK